MSVRFTEAGGAAFAGGLGAGMAATGWAAETDGTETGVGVAPMLGGSLGAPKSEAATDAGLGGGAGGATAAGGAVGVADGGGRAGACANTTDDTKPNVNIGESNFRVDEERIIPSAEKSGGRRCFVGRAPLDLLLANFDRQKNLEVTRWVESRLVCATVCASRSKLAGPGKGALASLAVFHPPGPYPTTKASPSSFG